MTTASKSSTVHHSHVILPLKLADIWSEVQSRVEKKNI